MALLFCDGFDKYAASADFALRYTNNFGTGNLMASSGRWGGGCVRVTRVDDRYNFWPLHRVIDTGAVHMAFHMYIDYATLYSNNYKWIAFLDQTSGTTDHYGFIEIAPDFSLRLFGFAGWGATWLAATSGDPGILPRTWHHIELAIKPHATEGFFRVWVDEVLVMDFTGETSRVSGWKITNVSLGIHGSRETRYDDFLIWDETGSKFVAPQLRPHRINTLTPNANGNVNEWTPSAGLNYYNVDDAPFEDANSTYNSVAYTAKRDLYAYPGLGVSPLPAAIIRGAVVHTVARSESGTPAFAAVARKGTAEIVGTAHTLTTSFADYLDHFPIDPETGTLWKPDGLSELEFGVKSTGGSVMIDDQIQFFEYG